MAAAGGVVFGLCIIFFEMRLERVSLKRLIGAACGSVMGIVGAFLMTLVLSKATPEPFLQVCRAAADDLRRPDRGRQERRHAQPGGAGRNLRGREIVQEVASRSSTPA